MAEAAKVKWDSQDSAAAMPNKLSTGNGGRALGAQRNKEITREGDAMKLK